MVQKDTHIYNEADFQCKDEEEGEKQQLHSFILFDNETSFQLSSSSFLRIPFGISFGHIGKTCWEDLLEEMDLSDKQHTEYLEHCKDTPRSFVLLPVF